MDAKCFRVNGKERKFKSIEFFNDYCEYGNLYKYDNLYKLQVSSCDFVDIIANSDDDAITQAEQYFIDNDYTSEYFIND